LKQATLAPAPPPPPTPRPAPPALRGASAAVASVSSLSSHRAADSTAREALVVTGGRGYQCRGGGRVGPGPPRDRAAGMECDGQLQAQPRAAEHVCTKHCHVENVFGNLFRCHTSGEFRSDPPRGAQAGVTGDFPGISGILVHFIPDGTHKIIESSPCAPRTGPERLAEWTRGRAAGGFYLVPSHAHAGNH